MRKATAGLLLLASCLSGSALAVDSVGGELNFSGRLVPQPCKVQTEDLDMQVRIPSVATKELIVNGGKGKEFEFSIGLSCKAGIKNTVITTFKGVADPNMTGLLKTTGTAKGIALRLLNSDMTNLDINSQSQPISFSDGINFLKFFVRVETLDAMKVTGGPFEAGATFELSYQ